MPERTDRTAAHGAATAATATTATAATAATDATAATAATDATAATAATDATHAKPDVASGGAWTTPPMAGHTRYAGAARARYARATPSDPRRADTMARVAGPAVAPHGG